MASTDRPVYTATGRLRHRWFGTPLLLTVALYLLPLAGSTADSNPNEVVRIELATSIAFWARFDLGETVEV